MGTWRELISQEMERYGESWANVVHYAMRTNHQNCEGRYSERKEHELECTKQPSFDEEFDSGFGLKEGCYFTVWTAKRVYFPEDYDGSESCRSVPRDPCEEATVHVGGGG